MIKIYKDTQANAIFLEDSNGAQFLNSLHASIEPAGSDTVSITDLAKAIDLVSSRNYSEFVDDQDNSYGNSAADVVNELNTKFSASGTTTDDPPTITSALTISSVEGATINYELTATFGVGYEWDLSNVSGIATVDGNIRKILGGSSLAAGTYNIPVKAINYNGEDSQTIVLTVSTPPFANTKSVEFDSPKYCGANAALLDNVLGRTGNGSGSSDAWTFSFWVKPTNSSTGRVIFYYGSNDTTNDGIIELRLTSTNKLRLQYGSNNNYLRLQSTTVLNVGTWQHICITYNGGTTGSSSADISNYYDRFGMFIDATSEVTNNSHNNYGWSSAISGQNLRIGKLLSGNTLNGEKIDEFAFWDSDQSANVSDIYNNGTPFDLSTLAAQPPHWARMGDGDTYPYLQDSGTLGTLIWEMYGMTVADIVNDVP